MAPNLLLLLKIDFGGNKGRRSRGRGTEQGWGGGEDLPNGGWDLEDLIKTLSQNIWWAERDNLQQKG